jgi:hypothetical protein
MKIATLIVAICGLCATQALASHPVSGYTRRDGTYVRPHTSRDPGEVSNSGPNVTPILTPILIFTTLAGLGILVSKFAKTARPASAPGRKVGKPLRTTFQYPHKSKAALGV